MFTKDQIIEGLKERIDLQDEEIKLLNKMLDKQIELNKELDTELGKRNIELKNIKSN